jgi:hypothetical protein
MKTPVPQNYTKMLPRASVLISLLRKKVFLLALRIECLHCPNTEYVEKLNDFYIQDILASTILV